uniref:SSD domain-containing protein n=1 Tax=Panagrolaimus sp. PS1159 TaxID=55785 RepID=A0AC35GN75_9BILA
MCLYWFKMFETINHGWGQLIADHPYKHMIVSLIVMFLLTLGVINIKVENDIRASFSPPNSRASYENKVYKEFFNLTVPPQRAFVLFSAKDNASMIREQQLKDVLKFDKYFNEILSRISPESGLAGCSPLCNLNQPFHLISNEMFKMYNSVNKTPSNDLILDFPMSTYKGQNIFIGMNLAGAQTSNHLFPSNNSRIISVKTIILWYFSRADTKSTKEILREKSIELFEHAKNGSYLDNVKFEIFGDEIANREMVRGAIEATTLMSIGVFLLIGVVSLSTYRRLKGSGFSAISLVVFVSVLSPFLASAAAFGILTWLGNKVYTIMCVTPFLVLGVGVDDAFILIECWTN